MRWVTLPLLVGVLFGTQGCLVPRVAPNFPPDIDGDKAFSVIPHFSAIAAGKYNIEWDSRPFAVDSFWVYWGERGGYVLHSERSNIAGEVVTAWLEVDQEFMPIRGWEEKRAGNYRCAVAFWAEEGGILFQLYESGQDGRQIRLAAPERYGVGFQSPIALGWSIMASTKSAGRLLVLEPGHCMAGKQGLAGFAASELSEISVERRTEHGYHLDVGRLHRQKRKGGSTIGREVIWVDLKLGIPTKVFSPEGEGAVLEMLWAAQH